MYSTLLSINDQNAIFVCLLVGCLFFGPIVYGISLCLNNDRLSAGMKALWVLAFLSSSLVALAVYFAMYKSRQNTHDEY